MGCYLAIKRNENLINGGRDRDEKAEHRGFGGSENTPYDIVIGIYVILHVSNI